ncbi:MAG: AbrB/MazE/SpoVT family DNA-binding domain-containing protein [Bacteroidota bacterium]
MGRRTIEEHYVRNLMKTGGGNSYIISLPIDLVRKLEWKAKQKLVVEEHKDGLLIRDWKKK